jgi:hypothetical protein
MAPRRGPFCAPSDIAGRARRAANRLGDLCESEHTLRPEARTLPAYRRNAMIKIEVEDGNGIWSEVRGADGTPPGEPR